MAEIIGEWVGGIATLALLGLLVVSLCRITDDCSDDAEDD